MNDDKEVIISVAERYSAAFRVGKKTAEVRRRRLNIEPETRVWIYTKSPEGKVELIARVEKVVTASPRHLWKLYGVRTALQRREFLDYLEDVEAASVILLHKIKCLSRQPTLAELRKAKPGFQPPQFAKFIWPNDVLYRAVSKGNSNF